MTFTNSETLAPMQQPELSSVNCLLVTSLKQFREISLNANFSLQKPA